MIFMRSFYLISQKWRYFSIRADKSQAQLSSFQKYEKISFVYSFIYFLN